MGNIPACQPAGDFCTTMFDFTTFVNCTPFFSVHLVNFITISMLTGSIWAAVTIAYLWELIEGIFLVAIGDFGIFVDANLDFETIADIFLTDGLFIFMIGIPFVAALRSGLNFKRQIYIVENYYNESGLWSLWVFSFLLMQIPTAFNALDSPPIQWGAFLPLIGYVIILPITAYVSNKWYPWVWAEVDTQTQFNTWFIFILMMSSLHIQQAFDWFYNQASGAYIISAFWIISLGFYVLFKGSGDFMNVPYFNQYKGHPPDPRKVEYEQKMKRFR